MSFVVRKDPSHQFPYPESGLIKVEADFSHGVGQKTAAIPIGIGAVPQTSANLVEESEALTRPVCTDEKAVQPFDQRLLFSRNPDRSRDKLDG